MQHSAQSQSAQTQVAKTQVAQSQVAQSQVAPIDDKFGHPTRYWFGVNLLQNMLDRFDHGVFLLDSQGVLLFQNQPASELMAGDYGLISLDNRVLPTTLPDQASWRQALRQALAGYQPMLRLNACGQTTFVFMPIAEVPGERVRMVMVAVSKAGNCGSQTVAAFGQMHRLTRTEVQILHLLVNGASAHQIAAARTVAIATVRTHIKNLLNKTGHGGLRQLQAAMFQLPPVHGGAGSPTGLPQRSEQRRDTVAAQLATA